MRKHLDSGYVRQWPSKTAIADYLKTDGVNAPFLEQFNNHFDNHGLSSSNVDLGPGWAFGPAAPLRLMKGHQSQGGVLTPLVFKPPSSWKIVSKIVTAPVHIVDIMPTRLDIFGGR